MDENNILTLIRLLPLFNTPDPLEISDQAGPEF